MPAEVRESKRYRDHGDCSIDGVAQRLVADFGEQPLDIVVHSLANGPRSEEAAARDQPQRLPRRGLGQRLFLRLDGAASSAR